MLWWPIGCSGAGFGIGFEVTSSGSARGVQFAGQALFWCRIFCFVKIRDFWPRVEMLGTHISWLWVDVFLCPLGWCCLCEGCCACWCVLCVCVVGVAMHEEKAGLLLPGGREGKIEGYESVCVCVCWRGEKWYQVYLYVCW